MTGRIFLPSAEARLTRGPYILAYVLLHLIYFVIAFNLDKFPILLLLCMLIYKPLSPILHGRK